MKNLLKRFVKDEQGLETVEFAIMAGLIVVGVVAAVIAIGTFVSGKITGVKTELGA